MTNSTKNTTRRWPAWVILLLGLAAVIYLQAGEPLHRQAQVTRTMIAVGICLMLLLLWLLFFSRMPWRRRLGYLAIVLLPVLIGLGLFRLRGMSGDLVPILEWRWGSRAVDDPDAADPPAPAGQVHADYPQFLGPERNATLGGVHLDPDWQTRPPRQVWRRAVGQGWSAFAVAGSAAITQEQHGDEERVVCYDLFSGEERWRHSDPASFARHYPGRETVAGEGPRATPTISGERVYTLGATGLLNCLDLASGEAIWAVDIMADNQAEVNRWGISCSPLIVDSLVIVSAGGSGGRSLVAYHARSGRPVWRSGSDPAGYASPNLAIIGGEAQIVVFNQGRVVGHDPASGEIRWQADWEQTPMHIAQPVPVPEDRLFVSTGYGIGARLFQIDRDAQGGFTVSVLWKSPRLKAKFANAVYYDEFIYGLDDGVLVCLDVRDGERRWKSGRYGHGQLILADNLLLIQAEKGYVVLVEATPEAHRELARLEALSGKTWNSPALASPYLLLRNDRKAVCYELAVAR